MVLTITVEFLYLHTLGFDAFEEKAYALGKVCRNSKQSVGPKISKCLFVYAVT
jgi:hypothetical protein